MRLCSYAESMNSSRSTCHRLCPCIKGRKAGQGSRSQHHPPAQPDTLLADVYLTESASLEGAWASLYTFARFVILHPLTVSLPHLSTLSDLPIFQGPEAREHPPFGQDPTGRAEGHRLWDQRLLRARPAPATEVWNAVLRSARGARRAMPWTTCVGGGGPLVKLQQGVLGTKENSGQ